MLPAIDDLLMFTCFGCRKKVGGKAKDRGRMAKCPQCGEYFRFLEDDAPERMVEVWFAQQSQYARYAIDRVIHFIDCSRTSLDVAIYSLTHDWLKLPFEKAHQRGVAIRILTDKTQAGSKLADDEFYSGLGIQVARDACSGLMHHKFAIRDRRCVLTGSYNWSKSADETNRENFMILHYPHVVSAFEAEFEQLWRLNRGGLIECPPAVSIPRAKGECVGEG